MSPTKKKRLLGDLAIFTAAIFIYLSTVVIRWSQGRVDIAPIYFVFARFIFGFVVVCTNMSVRKVRLKIRSYHLLIGRAVFNCIAVACFYQAVAVTTVAEANILNMTFPLFVAVFSWILLKKQRDLKASITVIVAFVGVWLVLAPEMGGFKAASGWGLTSGITAAVAILYLNLSRQDHDTNTILFFMFGIGTVAIFILFHRYIIVPGFQGLLFLLLCAALGVIGQYLLTRGFRYVTAVEGSIVSSSRILMAALFGPVLAGDPALTAAGWTGAILIFGANVYLAVRNVGGG
jgi:drug/metabolite transporter (DMT)-like permease